MINHIKLSSNFIEKNSFIATSLYCFYISCLWHFVNDFVKIPLLTPLFPVNESVWEHSKLIFFPIIISSFFELYFIKVTNIFIFLNEVLNNASKSVIMMIIIFYTYSGALGKHVIIVDILIVLIVDLISFYNIHISVKSIHIEKNNLYYGIVSGIVMFMLMIYFTYNPFHLPLFFDNNSHCYGVINN